MTEEEEFLIEMVNQQRLIFEKAVKPYIDRLAYLRSMDTSRFPMRIPVDSVPEWLRDRL